MLIIPGTPLCFVYFWKVHGVFICRRAPWGWETTSQIIWMSSVRCQGGKRIIASFIHLTVSVRWSSVRLFVVAVVVMERGIFPVAFQLQTQTFFRLLRQRREGEAGAGFNCRNENYRHLMCREISWSHKERETRPHSHLNSQSKHRKVAGFSSTAVKHKEPLSKKATLLLNSSIRQKLTQRFNNWWLMLSMAFRIKNDVISRIS